MSHYPPGNSRNVKPVEKVEAGEGGRSLRSRRKRALRKVLTWSLLFLFPAGMSYSRDIPRFRINEAKSNEEFRRGVALFNQRKYTVAREFFYRSLNISPDFDLARRYLGDSLYFSGEWNEALEQWEFQDQSADGGNPVAHQKSALLRYYLGGREDSGEYSLYKIYNSDNLKASRFRGPADVYPHFTDGLYIVNHGSSNIIQASPDGDIKRTWYGPIYDSFNGPVGLAQFREKFYLADYSGDMVRVLNEAGRQLAVIGKMGSGEGEFRGPTAVAVNEAGIFVADSGNGRVCQFDFEYKFIQCISIARNGQRQGDSLLADSFPSGIALDGQSRLYVSNLDQGTIGVYDVSGNYLETIRGDLLKKPRGLSFHGKTLIVADEVSGVLFYDLTSSHWRQPDKIYDRSGKLLRFEGIYSARMDRNGTLYVADYRANRVDILMPRGLRTGNYDMRLENVETTRYPEIALFVRVTNRAGNPEEDIPRTEFRITENGQSVGMIRTDNMKPFLKRINMVFVREDSGAWDEEMRNYMGDMVGRVLDPLRIVDTVSVIRAGKSVTLSYRGQERRVIQRRIKEGNEEGLPNLGKGLVEGIDSLLDLKGSRNIILLVSGKKTGGSFLQYSSERVIQFARSHDVAIHVISFENEADENEKAEIRAFYERMASRTGGNYFSAYDESAWKNLFPEMKQRRDHRYIITYRSHPEEGMENRFVNVKISVHHMGSTGVSEGGYFVPVDE